MRERGSPLGDEVYRPFGVGGVPYSFHCVHVFPHITVLEFYTTILGLLFCKRPGVRHHVVFLLVVLWPDALGRRFCGHFLYILCQPGNLGFCCLFLRFFSRALRDLMSHPRRQSHSNMGTLLGNLPGLGGDLAIVSL